MRSPPRTGPAPPNSSSPLANEMPDGLRPLAHRYAGRLRDESWRQEVDALIERLKAGGQPLDRTSGGSSQLRSSARGGDRTRTPLRGGGFKPPASANSATRASGATRLRHT